MIEIKLGEHWYGIKENVMFNDLLKNKQDILRRIGFKEGDNISEICLKFAKYGYETREKK